jgi:hypothetical protein
MIILDAHLLLIVGTASRTASRDYITIHRRLRAYTDADYVLLTRMLTTASKIVVTPNTLTETSNLAGYIAEPARTRIYQTFRALVAADGTEERYAESKVAVNRAEFERIGLTDSCLLHIGTAPPHMLLTADLELYLAALNQGVQVQNFNYLRGLWALNLVVSTNYRCHRLCHLEMSVSPGVGRRAGAEPRRSAAPDRRPIERSS